MMKKINLLIAIVCFLSLDLFGQHPFEDRHTTNAYDGWISCTKSNNPAGHGNTHWIRYDFGSLKSLYDIKIWNINHPDYLTSGFKDVIIEYSSNGSSWTVVDTVSIPKASGSGFYEGFYGPDLGGVSARYLLITALSNHGGGDCAGLSEMRVYTQDVSETVLELENLTLCESDGIMENLTGGMDQPNGMYVGPGVIDNNGESFDLDLNQLGPGIHTVFYSYNGGSTSAEVKVLPCTNEICPDCPTCGTTTGTIAVNQDPIPSDYYTSNKVTSIGKVHQNYDVNFRAWTTIEMNNGFEVQGNSNFSADIRKCFTNTIANHSFENNQDSWSFWHDNATSASISFPTNQNPIHGSKNVSVNVTSVTGTNWQIQLNSNDHNISNGQKYMVTFYAKCASSQSMDLLVEDDSDDYVYATIPLTNFWKKCSYTFTATQSTSTLDVRFWFGTNTGVFSIDKVQLVRL